MSDDQETRQALDAAVRAHAEDQIGDGETITDWVVLAGVRRFDGGGCVIVMPSDMALPFWVVRGLLADARFNIDEQQAINNREED